MAPEASMTVFSAVRIAVDKCRAGKGPDPIGLFEGYMTGEGITVAGLEAVELEVIREIDQAIEDALKSRDLVPAPENALYDGFSEGGVLIGLEKRPI